LSRLSRYEIRRLREIQKIVEDQSKESRKVFSEIITPSTKPLPFGDIPYKKRAVWILSVANYTIAQIHIVTGYAEGTIKKYIRECRKMGLKERL